MLELTADILNSLDEACEIRDYNRCAFLRQLLTEGTQIVVPENHELTLDYDPVQMERFRNIDAAKARILNICNDFDLHVESIDISPSNTPGHYHGIVVLKEEVESAEKRAALQLLMGSDPVREKMVLLRTYANTDFPCVLFKHAKPKDQVLALQKQEYEEDWNYQFNINHCNIGGVNMNGPFTEEVNNAVLQEAPRHNLEPSLVFAIIHCESGGDHWAVRYEKGYKWLSYKDLKPRTCSQVTEVVLQQTSFGVMQVMGANFREQGYKGWLNSVSADVLWQVRAGCSILATHMRRYGDTAKAISAYNAGRPVDSNALYVKKVFDAEKQYRKYNPAQPRT